MLASNAPSLPILLIVLVVLVPALLVPVRRSRRQRSSSAPRDREVPTSAPSTLDDIKRDQSVDADDTTRDQSVDEDDTTHGESVDETSSEALVSETVLDMGVVSSGSRGTESADGHKERIGGKTRGLFASAFASIRGRSIDNATWDELEETLLKADIGIGLVTQLLEPLRVLVKSGEIKNPDELIASLRESMVSQLAQSDRTLHLDSVTGPNVWLFVGVNGVGKTTTIGKIGTAQTEKGNTVLMAAGDTFRAAAAEQLKVWADRCGAAYVRGAEGGDPASVIFDGVQSANAKGITLVLGDTAGRLQNKSNLMEELKKVRRVADKAEGTVNEVLLVIDATTGQNGLSQAREFAAATDVTGVVLSKLDGSAKGGIVFAIETELGIPVKLVGIGEGAHDLVDFVPSEFIAALFE